MKQQKILKKAAKIVCNIAIKICDDRDVSSELLDMTDRLYQIAEMIEQYGEVDLSPISQEDGFFPKQVFNEDE